MARSVAKRAKKLAESPSSVEGARKAQPERGLSPALATLVDLAPEGDEWLHEIKLDGYRLLAHGGSGKARLLTRSGQDWTRHFPAIASALRALPASHVVLDGEAVVLDAHGTSSFQGLQRALGEAPDRIVLFAFDLLFVDGWDLRSAALVERKRLLRDLLDRSASPALTFTEHVLGHGREVFTEACEAGVEGIVSKRARGTYPRGRSKEWMKVRCSKRQELVVVGFTDPAGSRQGFGALLLGAKNDAGDLRYAGKVGTGFSTRVLVDLHKRLRRLERDRAPVTGAPRRRGVHWVEPELVAEIGFTEWTRDGLVRHPTFLGLRGDKPANEVRVEVPVKQTATKAAAGTRRAPAPRKR